MAFETALAGEQNGQVRLRLLQAGHLFLPMNLFVDGAESSIRKVPTMSWVIEHKAMRKRVLFDLGIRKDIENYTPGIFHRLRNVIRVEVQQDVAESLTQQCIDPRTEIDAVIFSHLHWDHIGNPNQLGPQTKFYIGPGAAHLICGPDSYPSNPDSWYDSQLLPRDRMVELPFAGDNCFWKPFGPFPEAHDFFDDGSLYIINAPGHCPGHINLLAHISEGWVLLAGDSSHDVGILHGTQEIAVYKDETTGLLKCAHHNKAAAEEHLERIRQLQKLPNVEVFLAHDGSCYEQLCGRFR